MTPVVLDVVERHVRVVEQLLRIVGIPSQRHADADGNGGQAVLGFRQIFVDMNDLAYDEMPDVLGYSDESGPAVLHRADGVQTDSAIRSKYDVPIPAAADAGDAAGHQ